MNNSKHLIWIETGTLVGFLASFIFGELLNLPSNLYYLICFGIITLFFFVYIKKTHFNLKERYSKKLMRGIMSVPLYRREVLSAPLQLMLLYTSLRFFIHQKQNFSYLLIENRRIMRNDLAAEREDRFHPHRGSLDH